MHMEERSDPVGSRRMTLPENQDKVSGQVEGLAVAEDQSFLLS